MSIGTTHPAEVVERTDPSGRRLRQLTSAQAHSYPLYYFVPSTTADGRWLVFHSERAGTVQLYRMDLASGEITQLSEGDRCDAGWAIWCEVHLCGIDNHLSALNPVTSEAYYFVGETLYRVDVEDLSQREVLHMHGRVAISQNAFSPNGRWFAFVHTEADAFVQGLRERESRTNMGQFSWARDHDTWRHSIDCVISVVDTTTGVRRDVLDLDYHVHHVMFVDDETLLLNHVPNDSGMWSLSVDGMKIRHLRPRDERGVTCHQAITERGIYYEANVYDQGERIVHIGRLDPVSGAHEEVRLPGVGYVHTGYDPQGKFMFYEDMQADRHRLLTVRHPRDPERLCVEELRSLPPIAHGQRFHAHPFLAAHDRQWLYHTEVIDGFAQICALDVADLMDEDVYWDAE